MNEIAVKARLKKLKRKLKSMRERLTQNSSVLSCRMCDCSYGTYDRGMFKGAWGETEWVLSWMPSIFEALDKLEEVVG